jgi:cytochrome P450
LGKVKTQLGDTDVASLLLNSGEDFTDKDIVDELIDFLLAGSETQAASTQNIMMHFADSP